MDGYKRNIFSLPKHQIRFCRAFEALYRPMVRNTGCDPLFFTTPVGATHGFLQPSNSIKTRLITARSVEDETRNAELNGNGNPECLGDFSQLVKIEIMKNFGISRYKVESRLDWYKFKLRFLFDLNLQLTNISPPFRI